MYNTRDYIQYLVMTYMGKRNQHNKLYSDNNFLKRGRAKFNSFEV